MRALLFIILIGILKVAYPQGSFVSEYLISAETDQKLGRYDAELSFLSKNSMLPAPLREVEIRIGTEDMNTSVEDYRLRVSPTNPWEIRANKAYQKQLTATTKTKYEIAYSTLLKSRYRLLIDHYYFYTQTEIARQKVHFNSQLIQPILNENIEEIDLEKMIELESDIGNDEIQFNELTISLGELNRILQLKTESKIDWSEIEVITVETIASFINETLYSDQMNLYKLEASQELELEEKMLKISKNESFSNIGFLQANYETDRGNSLQEHIGFQVGITLPIFNRDRADLARDNFDLIEVQQEKEETDILVDLELQNIKEKIKSHLELFDLISSKIVRLNNLKGALQTSTDLSAYIKYKQYQFDLLEKQSNVYRDILEYFINYLELDGRLIEQPLKNYLSNNLEILE